MKVLIADDSRSNEKWFRQPGRGRVRSRCCRDGQQAWDALCKGDLRLAILDWVMPYMDGLEICRRLQKRNP